MHFANCAVLAVVLFITFIENLRDLLHLIENTFDRKRIYANPSSYPNPNSNSPTKAQ